MNSGKALPTARLGKFQATASISPESGRYEIEILDRAGTPLGFAANAAVIPPRPWASWPRPPKPEELASRARAWEAADRTRVLEPNIRVWTGEFDRPAGYENLPDLRPADWLEGWSSRYDLDSAPTDDVDHRRPFWVIAPACSEICLDLEPARYRAALRWIAIRCRAQIEGHRGWRVTVEDTKVVVAGPDQTPSREAA